MPSILDLNLRAEFNGSAFRASSAWRSPGYTTPRDQPDEVHVDPDARRALENDHRRSLNRRAKLSLRRKAER
jgi:hypothetical protein